MSDLDDLQLVLDRTVDLAKERLSDISNYPIIEGKIAFMDEDIMWRYAKANRYRPNDHMIEYGMWDMRMRLDGRKVKWSLENRKTVEGSRTWKLAEDILSVGTSRYKSMKRMSFFDRYRNKWTFHRKERGGIRQEFVSAFNKVIKDAIHTALADAVKEYKNGRL
jgi:hypothetical protein